jgi:ribosomal-protein-alanine N-acetyltransferase
VAKERLTIEPMGANDIPEVIELGKNTLCVWSEEHIRDELQQPTGFQYIVRNKAREAVLAAIFGRVIADEAEILKLNVADYARNKGLGYHLLDFAVNYCTRNGVKSCYLELRISNYAARHLYEKRGFSMVGVREKYYSDPVEDGILMRLHL